tara:strand:- start:1041 stop:1328 length:288 start_codon:yes stop_codon:yes gene_type:complete
MSNQNQVLSSTNNLSDNRSSSRAPFLLTHDNLSDLSDENEELRELWEETEKRLEDKWLADNSESLKHEPANYLFRGTKYTFADFLLNISLIHIGA